MHASTMRVGIGTCRASGETARKVHLQEHLTGRPVLWRKALSLELDSCLFLKAGRKTAKIGASDNPRSVVSETGESYLF